jgi:hypothetical protein
MTYQVVRVLWESCGASRDSLVDKNIEKHTKNKRTDACVGLEHLPSEVVRSIAHSRVFEHPRTYLLYGSTISTAYSLP